jgi:hypothetical protein
LKLIGDEMKILAIPKAVSSASASAFDTELVNAEVEAVLRLYQADVIREIYSRFNARGLVLILEGKDTEEVRTVLNDLPAVQRGILEIDLIPLAPFQGFLRTIPEAANPIPTHPH